MARSTRNRRSTKHRGNAAGMIETRGRTGRKPTASEKGSSSGSRGGRAGGSRTGSSRRNRYDKPPTWKGSAIRGGIAAVLVYGVIALLNRHQSAASELLLVPIVLAVYIPLIHFTDSYMYRRQQRRKSQGGGK